MKDLNLLIWLTQLGLSIALPPAGCILLALWLRDHCGWGGWVLWAGIILGIAGTIDGLRTSLKLMNRFSKEKMDPPPPSISFNEHD